ncbi:serine/threonine-protein kinase [Streptomyces sviceus]|uniref:serine/threonine-protein kinase n=1 Tax=Streptomyces sviceus TaxID=285530 RepID=UPI0036C18FB5
MKARRSAFPAALGTPAEVVAGRYRLGARLGSGGAADVYQGVDLRLKRPVAVKVFRLGAEPALEERFADESVLLAGLQHPGLVTLYDAGRHENRPFLVMELVKGPTLAQRISAGVMEPERVARLGTALAGALAHVHEACIVHRDVKPSNILLDTAGVPRLTDFGISRMMDATRHTASGALLGTAAYLAPEQVLGKGVGPAADIYALGLVLLECLKGELEYGGTPLEAAVARLHRPPVLPGSVPPRLAELMHAMTALEDTARPDARQCAEALSALSTEALVPAAVNAVGLAGTEFGTAGTRTEEGPAPTAAGPSLRQQVSRPLRTRRPLLVTGAAVLTALLGATVVVSLDGVGHGDDRSAPGSLGSTPLQQPSPTTSAESPQRAAGQPAASTSAPPSKAPRPTTSAASDPQARTPSSDPTSSSGPGTSADRKDAQSSRPRPGAARANDKSPSEKSAKSKDRPAGKEDR